MASKLVPPSMCVEVILSRVYASHSHHPATLIVKRKEKEGLKV